ncbi:Fe-S cluster assembly protein SufD [Fructilactobacillus hinvesii]|uniref:Fe-S cluster assembly protein SufD n=1 Tax=Fructilactobacillus hinvesii TaxID=2940300 RepID=A0ABY5BVC0_9LACO|nr:Fe-S cluster assembly protein SufD [Fructilactobacillus hinvesii]USS88526.1 Fe-S cluster assembly protein SufD [Fructilactobacillus hinvesii]
MTDLQTFKRKLASGEPQSEADPTFAKVRYHSWHLEQLHSVATGNTELPSRPLPNGIELVQAQVRWSHLTEKLTKQGIVVCDFQTALSHFPNVLQRSLGQVIGPHANTLAAINWKEFTNGILVWVPAETHVTELINVIQTITADLASRLIVYVENQAQVTILSQLRSTEIAQGKSSLVMEVVAEPGAEVNLITVDEIGPQLQGSIFRKATVRQGAQVNWYNAELNQGNQLIDLQSQLVGTGAQSLTNVIALTSDKQIQGLNTKILNQAPHTVGNILQRGVILDRSRLVFNGIGEIKQGAVGSDAQQESRVLMLSKYARGDANPLLLIDESDVTAGHAASVGRVDADQLYYLMSRGIDKKTAQRLVIRGFLGPVVVKIPTKEVQQEVINLIEKKLVAAELQGED